MQQLIGKLNINIGKTGFKKIDENYNDVATEINKSFENDYFKLTLESMAADPAYLIYEYNLQLKNLAMTEIKEVPYDEFRGYNIYIFSDLLINDEKTSFADFNSVEKISESEFKLVKIINIANIKENVLDIKLKLRNLYISDGYESKLNVDIGQEMLARVTFKNKEQKILAETKLTNGSTLYIEEVANSKFENYVLARIVTKPTTVKEMNDKSKKFMSINDPQFAICDQNGSAINFDFIRLDEYYEKILNDGTIEKYDSKNIKETDLVRMQQVQLIKLGFEEGNIPEKLKVLPIDRKFYNDRNDSEKKFYKNEDWYQVKKGKIDITEESQIGGSVTITEVEETDDKIIFYYEKTGYVPSYIDFVLRVKSEQINYMSPRDDKHKNIDSDRNEIIYTKNTFGLSGARPLNYERMDNLDELEFAIFYGVKYDVLADELEFNWSKDENNEVAKIENIVFSESVNDINEKIEKKGYEGVITEINDKYLKFYSEDSKKVLILSNPKNYLYRNVETKNDLDFSEINVGDYFSNKEFVKYIYHANEEIPKQKKLSILKNKDK